MNSSSMFLQMISLHLTPFKQLLFSLTLSASFIETRSVGLSGCHGKCVDPSIPFSFGFFVLAPLLVSTWIVCTHKKNKVAKLKAHLFEQNGGKLLMRKLSKRKKSAPLELYTAEDMKKATNNYSDRRALMHRCNPGTLYRGTLSKNDNQEVVIMKIQRVPQSLIEQFVDQVIFLSQPHRNLVRIIGCCLETGFPLLVYQLHGEGVSTLFDCIHDDALVSRFSCELRVKAAAGAARGLTYLQSQKNPRAKFVHGNISSDNILLDDSFDAKVFYSVPSNLIPGGITSSHENINCVYKDPEFIISGRLDEKNDVYGFGAVLAELVIGFGRDKQENDENLVVDFVSLVEEDKLLKIFDDKLNCEKDIHLVKEVAMLAARCLSVKSEERPNMKEVEAKLTALMNLK